MGGGYAGVEAMAELEDLARFACRYYPRVHRQDMRWVLVEAAPGILPEIGSSLGDYTLENCGAATSRCTCRPRSSLRRTVW